MKYFTFISFLFLSITLSAQMIMEEIAYVPSPSGYYNNLIVKGDVYINNLVSDTFNIRAYSSMLTLDVAQSSTLFVDNVEVPHKRGSVFLSESTYDIGEGIIHILTGISAPWTPGSSQKGGGGSGGQKSADNTIPININGGSISISNIPESNASFSLRDIQSITPLPNVNISAHNISDTNNIPIYVKNLSIFGMDIPKCPHNYYWQKVMVGSNVYTVLACRTSICADYLKEERCIQNGGYWNDTTCKCLGV